MNLRIFLIALPFLSLDSCKDRREEEQKKQIEAAKRIDQQHDKAMEEASHGDFPEPKPAGPIR